MSCLINAKTVAVCLRLNVKIRRKKKRSLPGNRDYMRTIMTSKIRFASVVFTAVIEHYKVFGQLEEAFMLSEPHTHFSL